MKFTRMIDYFIAWLFVGALIYSNGTNSPKITALFAGTVIGFTLVLLYKSYRLPKKDDNDNEMFI